MTDQVLKTCVRWKILTFSCGLNMFLKIGNVLKNSNENVLENEMTFLKMKFMFLKINDKCS